MGTWIENKSGTLSSELHLLCTNSWKVAGATPQLINMLSTLETSGSFRSQVSFRSHTLLHGCRNACNISLLHAHGLSPLAAAARSLISRFPAAVPGGWVVRPEAASVVTPSPCPRRFLHRSTRCGTILVQSSHFLSRASCGRRGAATAPRVGHRPLIP